LLPFVITVNDPNISNAHFSKDLEGMSVITKGALVRNVNLFF